MRRLAAHLFLAGACAATVLLAAGLAIHATVRDARQPYAGFFYALPWPVMAGLAALLAVYWARRRQRVLPVLLAAAGVVALVLWFRHGWFWVPTTGARRTLRVVHWNVDRPAWRLPGVVRWLQAQDADVITIAERFPSGQDLLARWQAAFPDYELVVSDEELLCLVRGEILSVEDGLLPHASYATLLRTRVRGQELTVLQVDIQAHPFLDRRIPLQRLAQIVAARRAERVVIAGDFNTPLDSILLAELRSEATNAFEASGRGCAATWPRVPLLSLDQIWANDRLRVVRCQLHASWRSDHRAVVADFNFNP